MAVELRRCRFTIDEFQRMAETGILDQRERVELVEGEIVEMIPIGRPHQSEVDRLTALFTSKLRERVIVRVQGPVVLRGQRSVLQPDVSLLRPRPDFYRSRHPERADVFLVVEVMDSSEAHDRGVKLPIYARAGVREVWLVAAKAGRVEAYRRPMPRGYAERHVVGPGDSLAPEAFPEMIVRGRDITG